MSDDPNAEAPPTVPAPSLVVGSVGDGSYVAHLHFTDKLRTVFGRNLPELGRRLVSAAIGEFGMKQEDAQALVDDHGLASLPTAAEHADLKAELALAKAHLEQVLEANGALQAQLDVLRNPPNSAPATGAESQAGEGATPPASASSVQEPGAADEAAAAGEGVHAVDHIEAANANAAQPAKEA